MKNKSTPINNIIKNPGHVLTMIHTIHIPYEEGTQFDKMIKGIKDKTGMLRDSEVVRHSILQAYQKFYKDYLPTPEERKSRTKYMKESLSDQLNGIIFEKEGVKYCKYMIHEKINSMLVESHEQIVPLSMLTEENVTNQYYPSKEEVLEIQKLK